jgi:hypothetical protein
MFPLSSPWIENAINNVDPSLDIVTIENPFIKESYDQILNTIWPPVRAHLQKKLGTYILL